MDYPGDPPTILEAVAMVADQGYMLSTIRASLHLGTHIDAPAHFLLEGLTIDQVPIERFHVSAFVIESPSLNAIHSVELDEVLILPGDAVLFKTMNGELQREHFVEHHAYISMELAAILVAKGVSMIGIDYPSVERADDDDWPVHKLLCAAGVLILEDLDLRNVNPGTYTLHCSPLRIGGAEAAPCRAVLETA